MKNRFLKDKISCQLIISVLVAITSASQALAASVEKLDGWELHQTSEVVGGEPKILITDKAIKISVKKLGLNVIALGPEWKVFLSNDVSKVFHECPLQKFHSYMNDSQSLVTGNQFEDLPLVKSGRTNVLGVDAIKYTTPASLAAKSFREHQDRMTDNGAVVSASYLLADQLGTPPQAGKILQRFYGLTATAGVPLEFKYINLGSEHHTRLRTT
jgi:hypothetical protein